jgi:hypothetical protein
MHRDSRQRLPRGDRHCSPYRTIGAIAALVLLVAGAPASAATDGKLRFLQNATSAFDSNLLAARDDPALQDFWHDHYWRMRGYAPFFDKHTFNASPGWTPPPAEFYRDLYAIYNNANGNQTIAQHPDWVLRDPQGTKLYIQYACSGTSCTQYAADLGNPAFRQYWIDAAAASMAAGYAGIHIDDVNLAMKVSNGAGTFTRPIDPRTGAPMTDADWRRYVAEFTEEIRDTFPNAEISHNTYWRSHSMLRTDPYALRQLTAADTIEVERGFNDSGIVGGTGPYGYETYLAHMDWLHARGLSIVYEPYALDTVSREFEIASYYLVKDREDAITSHFESDPGSWSTAWDTNLGAPTGPRYAWNGLLRRDFANGAVLVNQPGQTTKTVDLPRGSVWRDLRGNVVTSVALAARRGKVLVKASTEPPPPPPPPPPDETTAPETTIPGHVTIRPKKPNVRRGSRIVLIGTAVDAQAVEISGRRGGGWRNLASSVEVVDDAFRVAVRARRSGRHWFRASAPGLTDSATIQVRVKA